MRILDKYILKSFLVPFFATFFIVMFVLVMQFLWFAFDDIAGKDIDIFYIFKFLGYTSLQVTPTALPIGVLLSSIMALGNLSEKYEMAAVKSAGISLKRFIRPLVFLTLIISAINFLFLNNIYPYASLKQRNLLFNMKKTKPALALIEGSFNTEIPGYSIYFEKKYGPEENLLKNVKIYDLHGGKNNDICITAKKGEITTQEGSKYMTLHLTDGYYYQDHTEERKKLKDKEKLPGSAAKFDTYNVNIDISSFNGNELDLEKYKTHYSMLNVNQLAYQSDTLKMSYDLYIKSKARSFFIRNNGKELYQKPDSTKAQNISKELLDNFDLKTKVSVTQAALTNIKKPLRSIKVFKESYKTNRKRLNLYDYEFHYRLAFSLSCLLLFFIGAPLGSLIRKGGFGLPMVLAILIFVVYFFVNSLGRNIAEESSISSTMGGWFATMILTPFAFFLTKRATKGIGLVNFDKISMPIKNIIQRFKKTKTTD
ncbi:LptF/LptG family permease [Flavicella sediminum]|uniref:LptF/LptG family permease n=1 Tax=Flavicella sediminum TaxID=2585141 RepID=UPI00111F3451|nr:LptF/LptG family permease [Flavicella sediminum]